MFHNPASQVFPWGKSPDHGSMSHATRVRGFSRPKQININASRQSRPQDSVPDFTPYHQPSLPGLLHGGFAQILRRQLTPFGSGWQGMYKSLIRELQGVAKAPGVFRAGTVNEFAGENAGILLRALRGKPEGRQLAESLSSLSAKSTTYLGGGLERMAFDIGGERVVKIGVGAPASVPRVPEILQNQKMARFGKVYMEVAPKVITEGATKQQALAVRDQLLQRGYHWSDALPRNIGFYRDKPVIIDHGFIKKSRIRDTIRKFAMQEGLNTDLTMRRLDEVMKESGVRSASGLSPQQLTGLREEIAQASFLRRKMMLQRAKDTARAARAAGKSRAAAGIVSGSAPRTFRPL
jgi:hypothetical protein